MGTFKKYNKAVDLIDSIKFMGIVKRQVGLTVEAQGPQTEIGELCNIRLETPGKEKTIQAEVVGFNGENVLLMPYDNLEGIYPGAEVIAAGHPLKIEVSEELLGRVINGIGRQLDNKEDIFSEKRISIFQKAPGPLERKKINRPLITGIRAIDGFLTIGEGQRIGIFSGAGVGKSTLLGMLARNSKADINVIALIGERGREVQEFITRDLGEEGLKKSVVVAATSDTTPLMRIRGAFTATTIAEYFRDKGMEVALFFDSVTRFARAQREIGLAVGEPPTTSGFPPSVFSLLPRLLERAGKTRKGSITGFYAVLVEGDDFTEPVTDTVRGILDGHIILDRELAEKNHYPAVDILKSVSRLMVNITSDEYKRIAGFCRRLLAIYKENEDLITIGAYKKGSDPEIDRAIELNNRLTNFLQQEIFENSSLQETGDALFQLLLRSERNGLRFDKERDFHGLYEDEKVLQRANETINRYNEEEQKKEKIVNEKLNKKNSFKEKNQEIINNEQKDNENLNIELNETENNLAVEDTDNGTV